jgi:prepilin-type processing-associated H-X9-DG protein
MKNINHKARCGFSLLDLLLVIAALAGIVLVILPQFARSHTPASRGSCTNNLKQVGLAFRIWAGDNNDKMPMQVSVTNGGAMEFTESGLAYAAFLVMSNELNTPKVLFCPEESNRQRAQAIRFGPPALENVAGSVVSFGPTNNLSYFAGLDATDTKPEMILTGDDHFQVSGVKPKAGLFLLQTNAPIEWRNERHPKQGNIGMADGSVQSFSTSAFRRALVQTGIATNRLAMP